jgi:hypothetical protein
LILQEWDSIAEPFIPPSSNDVTVNLQCEFHYNRPESLSDCAYRISCGYPR